MQCATPELESVQVVLCKRTAADKEEIVFKMRYQFMRFPQGKAKAVTLSYDDGCREDIRFSNVISSCGMKCTFNLNSVSLGKCLSKEEVEEYFLARGHEIAVHGEYHRANGALRAIEGIREVLNCRTELENRYGIIIRGMAYPDSGIRFFSNNASYCAVKSYLTELDIAYARTLGRDNDSFALPEDWHAWMPTAHHKNPKLMEYISKFIELDLSEKAYCATRMPALFYMWGHSYEFGRDDNWELLDEICEKISGKGDIWYATNMEIYEYVNAYSSLIYSADGRMIYNPTLFDIWLDTDGTLYEIKSGETVKR